MTTITNTSFFSQFGINVAASERAESTTLPFNNHPLLATIIDSLSRKNNHHVIIQANFSPSLQVHLVEALSHQLTTQPTPPSLQGIEIRYLDIANIVLNSYQHATVEQDFHLLYQTLNQSTQLLLIALPNLEFLAQPTTPSNDCFLRKQFNTLLTHPQCRFLVFSAIPSTQYHLPSHVFTTLTISSLSESDILNLLKLKRIELENYHRVVINDECLLLAYSLTERYLSIDQTLDKTLLLLDSSAARASIDPQQNIAQEDQPPQLTTATITAVLSNWTGIPAPNLMLQKFKVNDFTHCMQRHLFGQEIAITLLAQHLLTAHTQLQQHIGPFCSLLFAGPSHSGKRTAIIALANYLFEQPSMLFFAEPLNKSMLAAGEIKLHCHLDNRTITLKQLLKDIPSAMIVFDNIEEASTAVLDDINEIISTGFLYHTDGTTSHCQHSTFIFTTACVDKELTEMANTIISEDLNESVDLLQLVMNEKQQRRQPHKLQNTPEAIATKIAIVLAEMLPKSFCRYVNCIPFLPLQRATIEKIMQMKLQSLRISLHSRYGIEFNYAPEVIRYLSNEILHSDCDQPLRQLYFVVEQATVNLADNKHRSNQLFLQLNETGQVLKCDWLASRTVKQHTT